ncbi:deoxyribodipyrimidine photolyase [bacterium]|nr:deoxyribodipyrimidine photolyase [bacterium]
MDHPPLARALEMGDPVIGVYLWEPGGRQCPDFDPRHARFVAQSLDDLRSALFTWGVPLFEVESEALAFFEKACSVWGTYRVFSHQEVGNAWSFHRDVYLKGWFHDHGIDWIEWAEPGWERGLKHRLGWDQRWGQAMRQPVFACAQRAPASTWDWASHWAGGEDRPECARGAAPNFQQGGTTRALTQLDYFLANSVGSYRAHLSKPMESRDSCSRMSPYLAWGNLSLRWAFQRALTELESGQNKAGIRAWASRLHWQSHFVQKFESESRMEFEDLNRGFSSLGRAHRPDRFEAFVQGQTGYPLVDASVRCLSSTGYLNFRMRAMLVSFATHWLRLPWQSVAPVMARWFLDYLPGIHYPQLQMQSGTTGINALRVYNPIKQALDHDPQARFVQLWVPELANLPPELGLQPWTILPMEELFYGFRKGKDYPEPVVDFRSGIAFSAEWHAARKSPQVLAENRRILARHTTPDRSVNRRSRTVLKDPRQANPQHPEGV